ncbi:hypothetical protein, partial [Emticicia aquatica]|uniref:hypothetical protein n=1 Tax=Emticicia aquatica TaxID=1681835 RepID=UPI001EECE0EC
LCPNKFLGMPRCRSTQDRQKPDIPSSISGFLVGAFVYLSDCWRRNNFEFSLLSNRQTNMDTKV